LTSCCQLWCFFWDWEPRDQGP